MKGLVCKETMMLRWGEIKQDFFSVKRLLALL